MAIASLSTISTAAFKGGRGLSGTSSTSLVGRLNTAIAKINEVISGIGDGSLDTLVVGTVGGSAYYASNDSWLSVDGTNPPTMARVRLLDEGTGGYRELRLVNGVVNIV